MSKKIANNQTIQRGDAATIDDTYKEIYLQVPMILLHSPLYKKTLQPIDKLTYGELMRRREVSRKNGWYDKDTRKIYFKYSRESLADLMGVSVRAMSDIRKRLINAGLLERVPQVTGGDKLYLYHPIVTDADIYTIEKAEEKADQEAQAAAPENELPKQPEKSKKEPQTLDIEPCADFAHRNIEPCADFAHSNVQILHPSNIYSSNTSLKDLNNEISKGEPDSLAGKKVNFFLYPDTPEEIKTVLALTGDEEKAKEIWARMMGAYKDSIMLAVYPDTKLQDQLHGDPVMRAKVAGIALHSLRTEQKKEINKTLYGYIYTCCLEYFNQRALEIVGTQAKEGTWLEI